MSNPFSDESIIAEMCEGIPIGSKVRVRAGSRHWIANCIEHGVRVPNIGYRVRYTIVQNHKGKKSTVKFENLELLPG